MTEPEKPSDRDERNRQPIDSVTDPDVEITETPFGMLPDADVELLMSILRSC